MFGMEERLLLKRFLAYYRPHKWLFTLDLLASLFVSLIGVVYPMVTRTMLNDLIPNKNYRMIVIFGLALLLLYGVRMLLNYFIQYQGHMMGVRMQAQMRSDLFNHLEKLPFSRQDDPVLQPSQNSQGAFYRPRVYFAYISPDYEIDALIGAI